MRPRRPLHAIFLIGVLAMGISSFADLVGWFDWVWLGLGGGLAVLLSAGIEAWLRSREGRPIWDDDST